ncbi:hypothetical protein AX17_003980 [Amanita inopinata Kibby_2008]|nr:hypothetical protein AX17_003980 [Amanita inopinata Kibby_2008]
MCPNLCTPLQTPRATVLSDQMNAAIQSEMQTAHTTTTTSTYTIHKYSRSYPTGVQTYSDWQHFTNPEIRLILDVKRSIKSDLEGVRLRIIWFMNNNDDHSQEDIDLLSFSSLVSDMGQQQQEFPLKAIHRDNLVGIRYIHPKESIGTNPVYRRFQITFASAALVGEFINCICTVCPCKASPANRPFPNPGQAQSQVPPGGSVTRNPNVLQNPSRAHTISSMHDRTTFPEHTPSQWAMAKCQNGLQVPLSSPQFASSSQHGQDSSRFTSSPTNAHQNHPVSRRPRVAASEVPLHHTSNLNEYATVPNRVERQRQPNPDAYESQLDHFSPQNPGSKNDESVDSIGSQIYASRENTSATQVTDEILQSLQDATRLYSLPPANLERIVANVVREDSFKQLVKSNLFVIIYVN